MIECIDNELKKESGGSAILSGIIGLVFSYNFRRAGEKVGVLLYELFLGTRLID